MLEGQNRPMGTDSEVVGLKKDTTEFPVNISLNTAQPGGVAESA